MIPGKMVKGMGGAMDLVAGVKKVVVVMEHNAKDGGFKFVKKCSLPLTGQRCVSMLITDLAVFVFDEHARRFTLTELAPGETVESIGKYTVAEFRCRGQRCDGCVPDEVGCAIACSMRPSRRADTEWAEQAGTPPL